MTFGLWNRKSLRDESKPLAATVSKSKWVSLKGKLTPRKAQQPPDTNPPVYTKDSAKDRPRETRSGAASSFAPIAPLPRPTGWPSRVRDKAARSLHLRGKLSSKKETKKQSSTRPLSSESWTEWDPEFYASTMEAERRAVAERIKPAVTFKKEEPIREEASDEDPKVLLPPLPPPITQNAGEVVEGTKTTSARPPVPSGTPDSLEAPPKSLEVPLKNFRSGHSSHSQTSQTSLRAGSSTPPGKGATPRATPDPIPYIVIEEATPKSVRTRRPQCVYQPPGFPAMQFGADGRCVVAKKSPDVALKKEEPEPANNRAESAEIFLPPAPPPLRPKLCNVVKDAERTSAHSPARRRIPTSSNVSPMPSASKVETEPTGLRAAPSGHLRLRSLPGLEPKASKVSTASPTIVTNPSGLLERENVTVRSAASEVPPGNHDLNDGDKGSESSRAEGSDRSDETPRASIIGLPREFAAAVVQHPSTTETNPSGLMARQNVSMGSAASEVPPKNHDLDEGDKGSESGRSGGSERSDETIRASNIGLPRGFGVAVAQQPTPSGNSLAPPIGRNGTLKPRSTNRSCSEHLRPPIAPSRGSQKPELYLSHRVPAVSETDHGREPTAHSSGSTSSQVGLSGKVMWARQLKYRLDFCATVGDRVKYAAAAQDALKAG
ncbi:hypothetical protein FS837_000887 [Tulasnella sp. UAMH 9824]|nr:hypothetical protein FS837_000887 [Tulasnella sp. UAMH 9824]